MNIAKTTHSVELLHGARALLTYMKVYENAVNMVFTDSNTRVKFHIYGISIKMEFLMRV